MSSHNLSRLLDAGWDIPELFAFNTSQENVPYMLMRMGMMFNIYGNQEEAWELQRQALLLRQHYRQSSDRTPSTLSVLVIMKEGYLLDNTSIDFLFEGSAIACDVLYVGANLPLPVSLPAHDAVFVAIAQLAQNGALFERVRPLLRTTSAPVLNLPGSSFGLDRDRVSHLLQCIPGATVPFSFRIDRSGLERMAAGGLAAYPLLVRARQSQAWQGLVKLERAKDTADYLLRCAAQEFFLAPYIDYRSADGLYRQCRLVLLRGQVIACHYAVSSHWMVHYRAAEMDHDPARRAEEARFLAGFEHGFGCRHRAALAEIAARIGLDYLVLDCGETRDGRLLFFDADTVGGIHTADPVDMPPYKQVQMNKLFQALEAVLRNTAQA